MGLVCGRSGMCLSPVLSIPSALPPSLGGRIHAGDRVARWAVAEVWRGKALRWEGAEGKGRKELRARQGRVVLGREVARRAGMWAEGQEEGEGGQKEGQPVGCGFMDLSKWLQFPHYKMTQILLPRVPGRNRKHLSLGSKSSVLHCPPTWLLSLRCCWCL